MRGFYLVVWVAVMASGLEASGVRRQISAFNLTATSLSEIIQFHLENLVKIEVKEERRERIVSVDALKEEAIKAKADRLAKSKRDNEQESASQSQSGSPLRIAMTNAILEQSFFRERKSPEDILNIDPLFEILLYIGDGFVIHKDTTYTISNGKVTLPDGVFLVCGQSGIALETEYICCGDNIFNKDLGPIECCANVFIYFDTEFCCADLFYPTIIPPGLGLGCCALTDPHLPYVLNLESCCAKGIAPGPTCPNCPTDGQSKCCGVYPVPLPGSFGCCGSQKYDTNTQFCCANGVVKDTPCSSICPGAGSTVCCGDAVLPLPNDMGCCGSQTYDTTSQFCCANDVIRNIQCSACPAAGPRACCGSNILPLPDGLGCCNAGTYMKASQSCCGGVVMNSLVCPQVAGCQGVIAGNLRTRHLSCCGGRAYILRSQLCCSDRRYDARVFCCRNGMPAPLVTCS